MKPRTGLCCLSFLSWYLTLFGRTLILPSPQSVCNGGISQCRQKVKPRCNQLDWNEESGHLLYFTMTVKKERKRKKERKKWRSQTPNSLLTFPFYSQTASQISVRTRCNVWESPFSCGIFFTMTVIHIDRASLTPGTVLTPFRFSLTKGMLEKRGLTDQHKTTVINVFVLKSRHVQFLGGPVADVLLLQGTATKFVIHDGWVSFNFSDWDKVILSLESWSQFHGLCLCCYNDGWRSLEGGVWEREWHCHQKL